MHKDQLKGKYITYIDNGGYRTEKVMKIVGNTLTVKNAVGRRKRINPKNVKILGRQLKNKIELIEWN